MVVYGNVTYMHVQGRREAGGQLPDPQLTRAREFENYPEIEQGPIKIGASVRH